MNLTLSIDDRLVQQARRMAEAKGTSLNQLIRDYLEGLTSQSDPEAEIEELRRLSLEGQGRSKGWKFNREEIHERT
jgi:replicative DNA helicase